MKDMFDEYGVGERGCSTCIEYMLEYLGVQ